MTKNIAGILIAGLLLSTASIAQKRRAEFKLLETGNGFHGEEVKARSGEQWLGLYLTKNRSELLPSVIRVVKVFDEIVDAGTNRITGRSVSVRRTAEPVFLVRGIQGIKPGIVMTTFYQSNEYRDGKVLELNSPVSLKIGSQEYRLTTVSKKLKVDPQTEPLLPEDARLTLTDGKTTQILYASGHAIDDTGWELIWAGDLDNDGKLDLYVNIPWHYNVSSKTLFLSSHAPNGKLVKKVAVFETTGC